MSRFSKTVLASRSACGNRTLVVACLHAAGPTRIPSNFEGDVYGRSGLTQLAGFHAHLPACRAFPRCAHHQHVHCALEDFHGPVPQRSLVGTVPADGDCFCGVRLCRGPESRLPQGHGKSNAIAAQGSGAPRESAARPARTAEMDGAKVTKLNL